MCGYVCVWMDNEWVDAHMDEWAGCMGRKVRACLVVGYVDGQVNKNKSNEDIHE